MVAYSLKTIDWTEKQSSARLDLTIDNQLKPCRQRVHEEVARIGDCYQNLPPNPPNLISALLQFNLIYIQQ